MPKTYHPTLYVNDFDLGRLGTALTNPTGLRDAVATVDQAEALAGGGLGAAITSRRPDRSARVLRLQFLLAGDTRDQARHALREMQYRMQSAPGTLARLRLFDDATKELQARIQSFTTSVATRDLTAYDVDTMWLCPDPQWYDVRALSLPGVAAPGRLPLPLGTGTAQPLLVLSNTGGAFTAPVVTYRHADGTVLAQLALTPNAGLSTGDTLVYDLARRTLIKNGTTNMLRYLSDDSRFFWCDPRAHGDFLREAWPTVEASAGTLSATYRRGWQA